MHCGPDTPITGVSHYGFTGKSTGEPGALHSYPIRLGRLSCPWNLVVIPLKVFDVVLGRVYLTEHQAVNDYEKRQVRLQEPGLPTHVYLACDSTSFSTFILHRELED